MNFTLDTAHLEETGEGGGGGGHMSRCVVLAESTRCEQRVFTLEISGRNCVLLFSAPMAARGQPRIPLLHRGCRSVHTAGGGVRTGLCNQLPQGCVAHRARPPLKTRPVACVEHARVLPQAANSGI